MKTSEGWYGAAVCIVLLIAALAESNYELWTVIAVFGTMAAMGFVYAGRIFEDRERAGQAKGFIKKWEGGQEEK